MTTTDVKTKANGLLVKIRDAREALDARQALIEQELRKIREKYGPTTQALKGLLNDREKRLVRLMKRNKKVLFADTDEVGLDQGALIHGFDDKVRIPRNAAGKIEHFGWTEALRYADPTVDRATVEKWPEERLEAIGAKRKRVETFEFEIKEVKP